MSELGNKQPSSLELREREGYVIWRLYINHSRGVQIIPFYSF
jgi:hypothetical protein